MREPCSGIDLTFRRGIEGRLHLLAGGRIGGIENISRNRAFARTDKRSA
jgi:hypothetical protein